MVRKSRFRVYVSRIVHRHFDFTERKIQQRIELNSVRDISRNRVPNSPVLLGIIYDAYQYHKYFVTAALELKLSFDVINIYSNDWWEKVNSESYDGFLIWPNGVHESLKSAYDSRIRLIADVLKKPVFPDYFAIWLYENKIRTHDWLNVNGFPTVPTYIYYQRQEAFNHLLTHSLPLVIKTNIGASGKGVYIVNTVAKFKKLINQCFKSGLRSEWTGPFAESRGYAFIQDFIPELEEWRMVRIGNAYFGHQKLRNENSGKHSGSLTKGWECPTDDMLKLLHDITEKGGFRSMNVDLFRTKNGSLYVNELHTVFGQSTEHLMILDGTPGRFVIKNHKWVFEAGNYVAGHSAKARILYFLEQLNSSIIE
ncbi:MAG: hypothetical protein JXB49_13075 [Bacteroidales bacterium]|nr:hypothetical protein [Bacteroidales bacterium]